MGWQPDLVQGTALPHLPLFHPLRAGSASVPCLRRVFSSPLIGACDLRFSSSNSVSSRSAEGQLFHAL